MNRAIIAILAVLAGVAASRARIITVDDDGPADFNNIQAAIDDANDGDTVLVADGTYTGDGNRDIDFHGKAITVISENGPENCIIDCNGSVEEPHRGFYFHSGEGPDSVLSGITVTHGYAVEGGGIYCDGNPSIENCIIARNAAGLGGGGMWLDAFYVPLTIRNCAVVGNTAAYDGGGAGVWIGNPLTFEACTFAGNSAEVGGGLSCLQGNSVLRNCIFWSNTATYGPEISSDNPNTMPPFTNVDIYYCDLEGGQGGVYDGSVDWMYGINFHEGSMDVDPCFADTDNDDYHLKSQAGRWDANEGGWKTDEVTSPCIDAGDPISPVGLEPFPNGGIINMGAYAGTSEASKSYFAEPVCETIVAGDVNGDCIVDYRDFCIMALHWMEEH